MNINTNNYKLQGGSNQQKYIILSSDENLNDIYEIYVREHKFKNTYDQFDDVKAINKTVIQNSEYKIDVKSEYYSPSTNIGVFNFLKIPINLKNNETNVISFYVKSLEIKRNINHINNTYYYDDIGKTFFVLIRECLSFNYFYYQIKLYDGIKKIDTFPDIDQFASEIKIIVNDAKNLLYNIRNILNHMLLFRNPAIEYDPSQCDTEYGYYDSYYIDVSTKKYPEQLNSNPPDDAITKRNNKNKAIFENFPLVALPIPSYFVPNHGMIQVAITVNPHPPKTYNIALFDQHMKIPFKVYTSVKTDLEYLLKLMNKFKRYTKLPLFGNYFGPNTSIVKEIDMINNYIKEENIFKIWETIWDSAPISNTVFLDYLKISYNRLGGSVDFDIANTGPTLSEYLKSINTSDGLTVFDLSFTHKKLIDLTMAFNNVANNFNLFLDVFNENILLLNNLTKEFGYNYKDPSKSNFTVPNVPGSQFDFDLFINATSNNINVLVPDVNNKVLKYYSYCFFILKNIKLHPVLSLKIKPIDDILTEIGIQNCRKIFSKLLLGIEGWIYINKQYNLRGSNATTIIIDPVILNDTITMDFINAFNSSEILNKFERVAYNYTNLNLSTIINPFVDDLNTKQNIHPHITSLKTVDFPIAQYGSIMSGNLFDYFKDVDNVITNNYNTRMGMGPHLPIDNLQTIITNILTNYNNINTYIQYIKLLINDFVKVVPDHKIDKLINYSVFEKLPVIKILY